VPWTIDDPPAVAKNKSRRERRACVAAANAAIDRGEGDEAAIHACLGAMQALSDAAGRPRVDRGNNVGEKRARFG
jgi:uncharacterized protein YdaT